MCVIKSVSCQWDHYNRPENRAKSGQNQGKIRAKSGQKQDRRKSEEGGTDVPSDARDISRRLEAQPRGFFSVDEDLS